MAIINELKWLTLTAAVNEMKGPNTFLNDLLFSRRETLPTETIVLDTITKGRECAPFVRKNGEGIMVGGYSSSIATVEGTNIRIKRPLTPSELLFGRRPGTVIFSPGAAMQISAIEAHIARDLEVMVNMVRNSEEYLAAQALTGTIAYSVQDQEVITITFPRSAANNITLSTFWNDGTPANVKILNDIHVVKQVLSDAVGLNPTDAILGSEASLAFRNLAQGGYIPGLLVQNSNGLVVGQVDFTTMFADTGVIFLGRVGGVNFWEYSRTASVNGTSTPMIRAKYAEFINRNNNVGASDRVMHFAAIPDMKALQGRLFQAERFSKSWEEEDPSAMMNLIHSRPMPVLRRPDATVSVKVVSG